MDLVFYLVYHHVIVLMLLNKVVCLVKSRYHVLVDLVVSTNFHCCHFV